MKSVAYRHMRRCPSRVSSVPFSSLLLCWALLTLLTACAPSLPRTTPLGPVESRQALADFKTFAEAPFPSTAEAGYDMSWQAMGQSGKLAVQAQMDAPEYLRLTALDPLGRTLYLALADGEHFTLVDNRAALVKRGRTTGATWRGLVPEPLAPADLPPLLSGRVKLPLPPFITASRGGDGQGFWFVWREGALTHHVQWEREAPLLARHLLADQGKKVLLDIRYLSPEKDRKSGYFWPRTTTVSGALVKGTLTLERVGELSFEPLPVSIFHPAIPPHFQVRQEP